MTKDEASASLGPLWPLAAFFILLGILEVLREERRPPPTGGHPYR